MDISAQFDQAFRVAQQSKNALAAGDKPAAFRLLKDAIALFMGVFPHVPDLRTKNLVAAVSARCRCATRVCLAGAACCARPLRHHGVRWSCGCVGVALARNATSS